MAERLPSEKLIVVQQVRLGETEADRLYQLAVSRGVSMGSIAREGIRRVLELEAPEGERVISWEPAPIRGRRY